MLPPMQTSKPVLKVEMMCGLTNSPESKSILSRSSRRMLKALNVYNLQLGALSVCKMWIASST